MNLGFRRTLQCSLTPAFQWLEISSGASPTVLNRGSQLGMSKPSLGNVETKVPNRAIKGWVRPYRYHLRVRKLKEQFLFPERSIPQPRYAYVEWNYKAELFAFGSRLSEKFDEEVLREALTDQSYIHKERKKQEEVGIDTSALDIKSNLELSELGEEITRNVLIIFLERELPLFPDAGRSALLKHLMSNETMSKVAFNLGLKDLILCEEYPPSDETYNRAIYAVIGAVSKSSGLERAEKFVVDFIASLLCGKDINEIWDIPRPWAMMEEISKQRNLTPVEPRLIRQAGRNTIHAAFVVGVYDKDKTLLGTGTGETVDIAQEMAARDVLKGFFNTRDPRTPFEFQSTNFPYKIVPHVRNISQPY